MKLDPQFREFVRAIKPTPTQEQSWRSGAKTLRDFDFLVLMKNGKRLACEVKPTIRLQSGRVLNELRQIRAQLHPEFADEVRLLTEKGLDPVSLHNAEMFLGMNESDPEGLMDIPGAAQETRILADKILQAVVDGTLENIFRLADVPGYGGIRVDPVEVKRVLTCKEEEVDLSIKDTARRVPAAQSYYFIGTKGFSEANPGLREQIASIYVPLADITAINGAMNEGNTIDEAVADWVAAHGDLIGRWTAIKSE